jgi:hypothetical protein
MAQLFINNVRFLGIVPMKKKTEAGHKIFDLIQDIGIPLMLHCDGARSCNIANGERYAKIMV